MSKRPYVDPVLCVAVELGKKACLVVDRPAISVTGAGESEAKRALLGAILRDPAMTRVLVFTRTKHGANRVARDLERQGVSAQAIHGNKSQSARIQALGAFKTGELRVLVATDIAARGLDVDHVSHVVNFELPAEPETYVHRIGRTARAGETGTALSFCDSEERDHLRTIEKLTRGRQGSPVCRARGASPESASPESASPERGGPESASPERGGSGFGSTQPLAAWSRYFSPAG